METTLSVTEAARNFADVVNRAYYRHEATTLLKNGKPVARVVPAAAAVKTGKEIAARMAGKRPRLTPKEAEAFDADLREARAGMPNPVFPMGWILDSSLLIAELQRVRPRAGPHSGQGKCSPRFPTTMRLFVA